MPQTRILRISALQPTEHKVSPQILKEIEQGKRKYSDFPEVWRARDLLILVDGHHRVYHALQQKQNRIRVNYHSQRNSLLTEQGYGCALEEALKDAAFHREAGIFKISDLRVEEFEESVQ